MNSNKINKDCQGELALLRAPCSVAEAMAQATVAATQRRVEPGVKDIPAFDIPIANGTGYTLFGPMQYNNKL